MPTQIGAISVKATPTGNQGRIYTNTRGVNLGNQNDIVYDAGDMQILSDMGYKTVRAMVDTDYTGIWAHTNWTDTNDIQAAFSLPRASDGAPYTATMVKIVSILDQADDFGIKVIVALNKCVGRKTFELTNAAMDEHIRAWRYIAPIIANHPALKGLEISNESQEFVVGGWTYWRTTVIPQILSIMRNVYSGDIYYDPRNNSATISDYWSMDLSYLTTVNLLDDPDIVYVQHIYYPLRWCIATDPPWSTYEYLVTDFGPPDNVINKTHLAAYVQKLIDFRNTNNVKILVGEFGAMEALSGRGQWIIDMIDILNSNNVDWCFHSATRASKSEFQGFRLSSGTPEYDYMRSVVN